MSDTIYRQDAIDELVRWGKIPEYNDGERNIIACTIGMLSSLPSAPKQRLIPCEKCWHGCPFPIHAERKEDE